MSAIRNASLSVVIISRLASMAARYLRNGTDFPTRINATHEPTETYANFSRYRRKRIGEEKKRNEGSNESVCGSERTSMAGRRGNFCSIDRGRNRLSFYIEYAQRISPSTKSPVVQDGKLVRRGGHFAKKGGSIAEKERTLRGCASTVGYEQLGPFPPNDKRTTGQLDFVRPLSAVDADKRYKQPNSSSIPTPKLRESPTRPSQEK